MQWIQLDALGKAAWFTPFDFAVWILANTFAENDIEKTAFAIHHGHWEFRVMTFGLTNAPAPFQRLMDLVLSGPHWTHCLVYLDDVVVFAATEEEHKQRLDLVLGRIAKGRTDIETSQVPVDEEFSQVSGTYHFFRRSRCGPSKSEICKFLSIA